MTIFVTGEQSVVGLTTSGTSLVTGVGQSIGITTPAISRVTYESIAAAITTPAKSRVTALYVMTGVSVAQAEPEPELPVSGVRLLAWDSGGFRRPYRYRTRLFLNRIPASFQCAQVRARDYTDLTMRIFADGALLFERVITSQQEFTLPPLPQRETEIELAGTSQVYQVEIAESMEELS